MQEILECDAAEGIPDKSKGKDTGTPQEKGAFSTRGSSAGTEYDHTRMGKLLHDTGGKLSARSEKGTSVLSIQKVKEILSKEKSEEKPAL